MSNRILDITKSAEFSEERLVASAQALLEEALFEKGCTKGDLAAAMGVSKARVSQIFSTNQNFTLRFLARAFHALGINLELSVARPIEVKADETASDVDAVFDYFDTFAWTDGERHCQSISAADSLPLSNEVYRKIARSLKGKHVTIGEEEENKWHTPAEEWGANVIALRKRA